VAPCWFLFGLQRDRLAQELPPPEDPSSPFKVRIWDIEIYFAEAENKQSNIFFEMASKYPVAPASGSFTIS